MKNWKRILAAALLLWTVGCGGQSRQLDLDGLAQELLEGAGFEDEMSELDVVKAEELYGLSETVQAKVYLGSGATAEEIALFELKDEQAAKETYNAAVKRLEKQKKEYASYIPQEVPRLENAVVRQHGVYVIVCVSAGEEAGSIVAKALE